MKSILGRAGWSLEYCFRRPFDPLIDAPSSPATKEKDAVLPIYIQIPVAAAAGDPFTPLL